MRKDHSIAGKKIIHTTLEEIKLMLIIHNFIDSDKSGDKVVVGL